MDRELDDEMQSHLDRLTRQYQEQGLPASEARRRARVAFGSVPALREAARDAHGLRALDDLGADLRYGVRMLRKRPGFTAVAVLSLAIGIGANTVIFSLVNVFLLNETGFDRPEELVNIYGAVPDTRYSMMCYPDFEDIREGTREVFSRVGVSVFVLARIGFDDGVRAVVGSAVSGEYFATLGLDAHRGRTIGEADDVAAGAHPVVVLGHGFWRRAFSGDPTIVGRELPLGGRAYTVIGVAPPEAIGSIRGVPSEVFVPMAMYEDIMGVPLLDERGNHNLLGVARLPPGTTFSQAEATVAAVATALDDRRPEGWDEGDSFSLVPTVDVVVFPSMDPYIRAVAWLLMVVVGLVLLLVWTNLTSFLLARARDRQREIAVRLALGATRAALVRQLVTETTLLSLLGGIAGLGLATGLLAALEAADFPLPFSLDISLDLSPNVRVLGVTFAVSALVGTLLGLLPALQGTRPDVITAIKQDGAGSGHAGQRRWRTGLVVVQLALSLVLLVGAGLFLRSFQQLTAIDPGFGNEPAGILSVMVPNTRFSVAEGQRYVGRLLERFRQLPGLETVGLITNMPLDVMSNGIDFTVDGQPPPPGRDAHRAERASVDTAFFEAASIPILRGRPFRQTDDRDTRPVAIVSEAMARRFWPDGDAVGRILRRVGPEGRDLSIVGVAADIKVDSLGEVPAWHVYLPYTQTENFLVHFVARTSREAEPAALAMATAGRAMDAEMMVWSTSTMARHLAAPRLPAQLGAFVLAVFAAIALVLAVIGLYGVVSYSVASRTREVGIRMALGASETAIVRLLAGDGLRMLLVGGAVGLSLALLASHLVTDLLVGVPATDLLAFAAAPTVLAATAGLASYLPARRASRTHPVAALRTE